MPAFKSAMPQPVVPAAPRVVPYDPKAVPVESTTGLSRVTGGRPQAVPAMTGRAWPAPGRAGMIPVKAKAREEIPASNFNAGTVVSEHIFGGPVTVGDPAVTTVTTDLYKGPAPTTPAQPSIAADEGWIDTFGGKHGADVPQGVRGGGRAPHGVFDAPMSLGTVTYRTEAAPLPKVPAVGPLGRGLVLANPNPVWPAPTPLQGQRSVSVAGPQNIPAHMPNAGRVISRNLFGGPVTEGDPEVVTVTELPYAPKFAPPGPALEPEEGFTDVFGVQHGKPVPGEFAIGPRFGQASLGARVPMSGFGSFNPNAKSDSYRPTLDRVAQYQACLNHLGYHIKIDGVFGPETKRAVMAWEKSKGIKNPEGMIPMGKLTLAMFADDVEKSLIAHNEFIEVDTVRGLQVALALIGGFILKYDGIMGPNTANAFEAYKRLRGYAPIAGGIMHAAERIAQDAQAKKQLLAEAKQKQAQILGASSRMSASRSGPAAALNGMFDDMGTTTKAALVVGALALGAGAYFKFIKK